MNKKTATLAFSLLAILFTGMYIAGCKKQVLRLSTTEDVNIVGYLEKYPDSFSLFKQILDRTENTAFLNAYGSYTCFAPTNSGVTKWLARIGAANVDAANIEVLKELVRFHVLGDTVTTTAFKDGKLPVPTMQGQFLITGVSSDGGSSSYSVNRQALVKQSNVKVGNGFIHVIDNVLVPATLTIAKQLEANANYSIFVQAMKETGYYNLLNTIDPDTNKKWMTVIAESNLALADSGIGSYAALKTRYSHTGNPTNVNDSLHMYMAYHILGGIKFLGDIITQSAHSTFEPQEVISTQLINQQVLVNEDVFNGILEKGVLLKRPSSDNAATNGVWHDAAAHFMVKYRKPTALYWDVSAFTDIMYMPAFYMKQNQNFTKQNESDKPIKDIDWHFNSASGTLTYEYSSSTSNTVTRYAVNNDVNTLPMGGPARATWCEYLTPVVIKGRYKVWICYRARPQSTSSTCQQNIRINGELMQRPMNFVERRPSTGTDAEMEAIGWKRYTENSSQNDYSSRLVGTVDIKTTQRQILRFEGINGTQNTNHLDMVHFIPIDEDQVLPRFKPDGTKIYF
jgi:uncharacterized surface protein with fasciclin (FAS1) repeats